jgi:quercetin dioxygenase-like cupin family protein
MLISRNATPVISFGEEKSMRIYTLIVTLAFLAGWVSAADGPSSGVILINHEKMAAGFTKGGTVLNNGAFQILTSHRVQPGQVEVHANYGDIMFVVEGSATIVTGGTVVDGKTTAPGEIRGSSITGGKSYHLAPGDVFVIQAGTPHWFQEVNKLVNYYVVKPRMAGGPPSEVVHIDHSKTAAGFADGVSTVLLDRKAYDVRTGHRVKPGQVETHMQYTDIIYVTGGSATFVTGGQVNGEKKDDAEEPRGKSITGGETHNLVKDDVIIVPNGTPHWFEQARDFTNFIVKVRTGN